MKFKLVFILMVLFFHNVFSQSSVYQIIDSLTKEIEKQSYIIKMLENRTNRHEKVIISKEMALRSIEEVDSIYQSLLAVQSYNFSINIYFDIDVYKALYFALKRFKDPYINNINIDVTFDPYDNSDINIKIKQAAVMADRLCEKYITRMMTYEEWLKSTYIIVLPYESTCPISK